MNPANLFICGACSGAALIAAAQGRFAWMVLEAFIALLNWWAWLGFPRLGALVQGGSAK